MKKIHLTLLCMAALAATSCDLYLEPTTSVGRQAVFESESGLKAYSWSFYENLPSGNDLVVSDNAVSDILFSRSLNDFIKRGSYNENESSGWSASKWGQLRNINFFIQNCTSPKVDEAVRNHYIGLARFFRAYFYYGMVVRFGDVPWYDRVLEPDDEDLYKGRDPRGVVMDNAWNDLVFAAEHIRTDIDPTCTMVTKWVAWAMASRLALFEGSFTKYHNLQGVAVSSDEWFKRAAEASEKVMTSGKFSLDGNYRKLFNSVKPSATESMMCIVFSDDPEKPANHNGNWKYNSATYAGWNFNRSFINTFLTISGEPYTSKATWQTDGFVAECTGRDPRLAATIRTPGYTIDGDTEAFPLWSGNPGMVGYHPVKLCEDVSGKDGSQLNVNALHLFRYAEVLLNYAEAKAELGTITAADWVATIGALRKRAGITGDVNSLPTTVDSYLKNTFYPDVNDPVILEIRRERAIELCLEGFRFNDIRRWKSAQTITSIEYAGINIPNVNVGVDMNGNGKPDAIWYTSASALASAKAADPQLSSAVAIEVTLSDTNTTTVYARNNNNGTYSLVWGNAFLVNGDRVWNDRQYLYPVPSSSITKNPNLSQNPGWENGTFN